MSEHQASTNPDSLIRGFVAGYKSHALRGNVFAEVMDPPLQRESVRRAFWLYAPGQLTLRELHIGTAADYLESAMEEYEVPEKPSG